MRLVDLQVGTDNGVHLELHPRLNVVIAPAAPRRGAALLGRAYVLAGTEVTGTVDGGDYLTPLDPTAVVALDPIGGCLDRIGPADLPGAGSNNVNGLERFSIPGSMPRRRRWASSSANGIGSPGSNAAEAAVVAGTEPEREGVRRSS